jgi:hypothetical protein
VTTNETPGQTGGSAATSSVIALLDRLTDPTLELLAKASDAVNLVGVMLIKVLDDKQALERLGAEHEARLDEAWDYAYTAEKLLDELRVHLGGGR